MRTRFEVLWRDAQIDLLRSLNLTGENPQLALRDIK